MIEERYIDNKYGNKHKRWFEDTETGHKYSRICCGLGFPFGGRPGFLVVLAESLEPDHTLPHSPRRLHLIDEHETSDFELLHRKTQEFKEKYKSWPIIADIESSSCEIFKRIDEGNSYVSLSEPRDEVDLNFISQSILKHTKSRKTLHFLPESRLPGYIVSLTPDMISENKMEIHPALSALGYALGFMDLNSFNSGRIFRPNRSVRSRRF